MIEDQIETVENQHQRALSPSAVEGDSDQKLIELFRAGDRLAFDRLVIQYQRKILTVCRRLLGDECDAEDAAQDTFVKAYKNIAQFKGDCLFSTWLYTIAVNTCRNSGQTWWRRMWKGSVKLDKPICEEQENGCSNDLRDTRFLPSKDLDRKLKAAIIQKAVAELPVIHRELVVLRDFQELSYEEIEVITGVTQGTIKSRLARARAALQLTLKGLRDEN